MLLYLVNPSNPLASMSFSRSRYWNRFRLWKPLSLLVLAGLTPPEWEISILDENLAPVDYDSLPRPDLVGLTAFTSQASRAYEIAGRFRARGVPVVMGGIHATMRLEEASPHVDSVVTGEAEPVWAQVLEDVRNGGLKERYDGGRATMDQIVPARHDLLRHGYAFGSIQTTRGCSLNCAFCSVTEFNGARYRQRPVAEVVEEFKSIPESRVLIVDDNLIGRMPQHIERAKELFRALAQARTGKLWIGQTTVNIADDEELLVLARKAGCAGLFIGFESTHPEDAAELGTKSAMLSQRDIPAAVERIHRHGMPVVGSFIMGLDSDRPGVGKMIAEAACRYGVDNINVLFLTPLPGTRLWRRLEAEGRIVMNSFPDDWKFYTLNYPVARYKHLTTSQIVREMKECNGTFFSLPNVGTRLGRTLVAGRNPVYSLMSNLTSRRNSRRFAEVHEALWPAEGALLGELPSMEPQGDLAERWESLTQQLRQVVTALKMRTAGFFGLS